MNILIIGGSSDISVNLAKYYVSIGYNVIVSYNNNKVYIPGGYSFKCDIRNEEDIEKIILKGISLFGKIDMLINMAAISLDNDFLDKTKAEFMDVLEVNLVGTFLCNQIYSKYIDDGIEACSIMNFVPGGGSKTCQYGCLGYGSCVKACSFGAISIVDGIAVVDKDKCKACGKCTAVCPRKLIEMVPYDQTVKVHCSSQDKGMAVMDACAIGCIGCKKCEKNCPAGAITVENNVAHIDYEKCTNCGKCKEMCDKRKCIY